jgi:hypothetical protein
MSVRSSQLPSFLSDSLQPDNRIPDRDDECIPHLLRCCPRSAPHFDRYIPNLAAIAKWTGLGCKTGSAGEPELTCNRDATTEQTEPYALTGLERAEFLSTFPCKNRDSVDVSDEVTR